MNRNMFEQMEQEIGAYQYQLNEPKVYSIDDVLTTMVMNKIEEKFEDVYILYYYMEIQMILQIKDAQIRTSVTNGHEQILVINLGLHLKGSLNKYLYGIIIMDDIMKQQQYKYLWQIDQFLSADEINNKYELDMASYPLPAPSQISYFKEDLNKKDIVRLIDDYNYKLLTLNNDQDGYKLVIDEAEWRQILKHALNNDDIPWIPVINNNDDELQIGHVKIIHIQSKDVYVGIQLERSLLPKELSKVLPQGILPPEIEQRIHEYTETLSIIPDPRFIVYASAAASLSTSISLPEMNKYSQKWVTDIKILDLNKQLTRIANNRDVDPDHVIQSLSSNDDRKGFSLCIKSNGIKHGKALKIYEDIQKLGLVSSGSSDNIQLHDFSNHLEQILQQQHKSQQEYIDHLVEESSKINNISISNNDLFEQSSPEQVINTNISNQIVQQMMDHFNQEMENMNLFINQNQNQEYHQNNDHQQYINYENHAQEVITYLY